MKWIDKVLELALERKPQPLPDEPVVAAPATAVPATPAAPTDTAVKH